MARVRVTNDMAEKKELPKGLPKGFVAALRESKDKAKNWLKDNKETLTKAMYALCSAVLVRWAWYQIGYSRGQEKAAKRKREQRRNMSREEINEEVGT